MPNEEMSGIEENLRDCRADCLGGHHQRIRRGAFITYKGKKVIRLIGKLKGNIGSMRIWFAGGGCQEFKIHYEEWTEVDGGWVYEPVGGKGSVFFYVKTDWHYRKRQKLRRAAS